MPDARSERAQVIVLVGPAGKTTLARMLERHEQCAAIRPWLRMDEGA